MAIATIEAALFETITGDAAVFALIDTRFYPNNIPQKAKMPAATYQQNSGPREHAMDGAIGMVMARYQINCWDRTYTGAKDVSEAIRKKLDGFSGTVNTVEIQFAMLEDESDITDTLPGSEVSLRYGKRLDFHISYQELTS